MSLKSKNPFKSLMKTITGRTSSGTSAQNTDDPDGRTPSVEAPRTSLPALDGSQYTPANGASTSAPEPLGPQDASDWLFGTPYRTLSSLREEGMGQAVVLALDTRTKRQVVIKLLERGPNVSPKVEPETVKHWKCRGHPNLIELLDMFITPKHLAIVMEYADGGALPAVIEQRGRFPEDYARLVMQQLLRALRQYHKVKLVKRDLRANVFICGDQEKPTVKLGDFSHSKTEQVNSDPKSALGSLVYTAPEEITAPNQSDDCAADVWGCGVLLYAMLCGRYPFGQLSEAYDQRQVQGMLQRIMAVEYDLPDDMSAEARHLLSNVLVGTAEQRLTLEQLCEHPWVVQGLPPGYWEVEMSPPSGAKLSEEQLRQVCIDGQRAMSSHPSGDIDAGIDEMMDMDECEAAFEDLEMR